VNKLLTHSLIINLQTICYTTIKEISFTRDRSDPDVHIPLEKYNRSELSLGIESCLCKNQN